MFGKMFGTGREQQYSDLEGGDWNSVSGSGRTEAVDPESPVHRRTVPIFVWPLLTAAVLAVSSAGAVFEQMRDVAPFTLAAWRLQLTSVILMCGALWQWRGMDVELRECTRSCWRWLVGSGLFLAVHFGSWVWSLEHTSLTHSLLLVCSSPVIMAGLSFVLLRPVSMGEIVGTGIGLLGGIVLALGAISGRESEVTFAGDAAALLAAVAAVGYLEIGRHLRKTKNIPIFVYAFPVTAGAALWLTLTSLIVDGSSLFASGSKGTVGWLTDAHSGPLVVYLSFGPGLVGHTGFNTLLAYLSPLVLALTMQLEPLLGSLMGWAGGVMLAPGLLTYLGGGVVLLATGIVTAAATKREMREERRKAASLAVLQLMEGPDDEELLDDGRRGDGASSGGGGGGYGDLNGSVVDSHGGGGGGGGGAGFGMGLGGHSRQGKDGEPTGSGGMNGVQRGGELERQGLLLGESVVKGGPRAGHRSDVFVIE
ncbi:MAG: hypothetical protein WDW36_007940 [Sanguina aurantia]